MRRFRDIAANFLLSLATALLVLLLCEFVVFRVIWLASDAPRVAEVNDVVRYAPNQRGVWRVRNEIAAPFRINSQGWNSGVGDYARERRPDTPRIAIVGDSFVEALQVANTASLGEDLQRLLEKDGRRAEVYRFGISGAPLSQYVFMVEHVVAAYRPDWIVVVVVHNDFNESYQFIQGRYTSSFMKFRVRDGKVVGERAPEPWHASYLDTIRETATARFFLYRWQVRPQAIVDLFLGRAAAAEPHYVANVDIRTILKERREVEAVADYGVERLAALAHDIGARLLLVMDGDRRSLYAHIDSLAVELNRIMAAAAHRHHVDFLDLQPVFAADWAEHHRRFSFDADDHWNELGHSIVAKAIAARIGQSP